MANCSMPLQLFYQSNARRLREKRHIEAIKKKVQRKICANERKFVRGEGKKKPVLFIGDKGHGVGSYIKKHRRYGGTWKQEVQGQNTYALITDEYMTCQTCVFCFSRVRHPTYNKTYKGRTITAKVNGSLFCVNPNCISHKFRKTIASRDQLSALAIGLSGLSRVLLDNGQTFPELSNNLSQSNADFIKYTRSFL